MPRAGSHLKGKIMIGKFSVVLLGLAVFMTSAEAVQPQPVSPQRTPPLRSAEQWVRQLENELDHLEEDVYYGRGQYPAGLAEQIDQASRAAAHFRQILRRNPSQQHLMRDFQSMDQQVHRLVALLEQSGDSWLRRQASRIRYPDEQLHYVLQTMLVEQPAADALLARHAHLLEREARNLQEMIARVVHRNDPIRAAVGTFVEDVEHFHQIVERGADRRHLIADFNNVDDSWRAVVEQINQSQYGLYLRRNAQNVNRIQNQIHGLLTAAQPPPRQVAPPKAVPPQQFVPQQPVPQRERPAIEFEIPGIGRFSIPR
jgi:hypothetical protein